MQINIPDKLIPLFTSKARFNVIYGGRASSKSHSVARLLILKALKEKCLILCTRHIQKSIAASSYSLLVKIIHEYELNQYFTIVENEIRCNRTGAKFIFAGLWQNLQNIKSLEGVNYCWTEESSTISADAWRVLIPTIRAENSQFFITFNPDQLDDPVYDMFITNQRDDALVIKINYNENPFLSDVMKTEIEHMKVNKPEDYEWIYGGSVRTTTQARILKNIVIHDFEIDLSREPYYGGDWGGNDPNTLIQSYIYDQELYICREFYECVEDPLTLRDKYLKIEWIFGRNVIADSSRPEMIRFMNSTGRFVFTGSKKNIGQPIKEGAFKFAMAQYLKSFRKIHIHATNCQNAAREFPRWSYKVDKNEKILDVVADFDDHSVDGLIYSHERPAKIWYSNNFKR
jgi:phage terminase large subunit